MEKLYRVQINRNGAPNFSTAKEVEIKQGEWIGDRCSICGSERAWYGLQPNFCPDCGAKMKGTDDE